MLIFGLVAILVLLCVIVVWQISVNKEPRISQIPAFVPTGPPLRTKQPKPAGQTSFYDLEWKPRLKSVSLPEELASVARNIEQISPLVHELQAKISDQNVNPYEVSRMISSDPGLTSFVLRRVNSTYYGQTRKVDNIFNAIIILGYNEIYRLVIEERLSQTGIKPSAKEWTHSNLVSAIAARLAQASHSSVPGGSLVTLAILHDIGRPVLDKLKTSGDDPVLNDNPREMLKAEFDWHGVDHAVQGAAICREWRLPERVCKAIEIHHLPYFYSLEDFALVSGDVLREASLIAIADQLAHSYLAGKELDLIGQDYFDFLKLKPGLDNLIDSKFRQELDWISKFYEPREPVEQ